MIKILFKKKKITLKLLKELSSALGLRCLVLLPGNAASPSLGPESENLRDQWNNFKIYSVSDWEPV